MGLPQYFPVFSSVALSCPTFCDGMDGSTPGFPVLTNSRTLLKLICMESVMPSNRLIPCHFLLLLTSIFPSIMVFSNESVPHIRWPKYWRFSISPSIEYSGLTSFRMDWLDLLAVQETLNEPSPTPQFKSINSSLLSLLHGPILTSVHNYCKIEVFFFSYFLFYIGV